MNLKNSKIAIVVSQFNEDITSKLLEGAQDELIQQGLPAANLCVVMVPGAVEIPLAAKMLAKKDQFAAIICLGAVIRGDTAHFDYVCDQASQGCQRVMLDFDIPVIFGVITTENHEQAVARCTGRELHKGIESAHAAIKMIEVMDKIATI